MTEEVFLDALSTLERDLLRKGLTLAQIQSCEDDALTLTTGEFYQSSAEYIRTITRLANAGLY